MLLFTDSTGGSVTTGTCPVCTVTGSIYKALPITLGTGAPGSVVTLGTSGTSTTSTAPTGGAVTTTTVTDVSTTYGIAGGFGSLSTYGVALTKSVATTVTLSGATTSTTTTTVYSSSMFVNGSSTASTSFNMTNPTSYHLSTLTGYSTADGFGLISTYDPDASAGTAYQINKDTYFVNGTAILSAVSLGTFDNGYSTASYTATSIWIDAVGSPWLGYITQDDAAGFTSLGLLAGYAGEIAYNPLGANALTSIFATLALMIAALFAF